MGPLLFTIAILLIFAIIIGAMWLGWNRRRRQQVSIPPAPDLPADLGEPVNAVADVLYVATTVADEPLNRIAVPPLAYRGRADVEVHPTGIAIGIAGERPFFIPQSSITLADRTTATIDRAVEPGGLIVVQWQIGPEDTVDTFLRVVNPAERTELLETINSISEISNATREEHK